MSNESNAVAAFQSSISIGDGASPEVFTKFAEIRDIPGIGHTHRTVEVTPINITGNFTEYIGTGLNDGKPFSVPFNLVVTDSQQQDLLETKSEDGSINNYRIEFANSGGRYVQFCAILDDITMDLNRDEAQQGTIRFRPTGQHIWGTTP